MSLSMTLSLTSPCQQSLPPSSLPLHGHSMEILILPLKCCLTTTSYPTSLRLLSISLFWDFIRVLCSLPSPHLPACLLLTTIRCPGFLSLHSQLPPKLAQPSPLPPPKGSAPLQRMNRPGHMVSMAAVPIHCLQSLSHELC